MYIHFVYAGYRSIQLKNGFSEELELATLLVHVDRRVIGVSLTHICTHTHMYAHTHSYTHAHAHTHTSL